MSGWSLAEWLVRNWWPADSRCRWLDACWGCGKFQQGGRCHGNHELQHPGRRQGGLNRAFAGRNKSAVVAELMTRAVAELEQQRRREEAFRLLTEARDARPNLDDASARQARETGRP